jgi:signal transduction histidine kinase
MRTGDGSGYWEQVRNTGANADKDCAGNKAQYCRAIFEQSSGALLANMGHELRTPLNGIIGFSELLERRHFGPLTEQQQTYVRNIQTCGWRLFRLVIDLVDLAKIEAGKLVLLREWTPLDPVLEGALGDAQALADRKRIALRVVLQPNLPEVWVDPARMQQVFSNLLAVALIFTPEGGSVRLTACEDQASVCVSVTGIRIDLEAEKLVRSELRIESVESPPVEQTEDAGLGLALAKRLLEMHGGHIHMDTDEEGGSMFKAAIPLSQQNEEARTDAA